MSHRDLSPEAAERLLAGINASSDPALRELTGLLQAAAAPATPRELSREHEAIAAFRRHAKPAKPQRAWWRPLTTRLAIAGAVIGVTVGVAAIAADLQLNPDPAVPSPAGSTSLPTQPAPTSAATRQPSSSDGATATGTAAAPAGATPPPSEVPASIYGHCQSYLAKSGQDRGKWKETPAYAELVAAAGSEENVEPYCTGVVASKRAK